MGNKTSKQKEAIAEEVAADVDQQKKSVQSSKTKKQSPNADQQKKSLPSAESKKESANVDEEKEPSRPIPPLVLALIKGKKKNINQETIQSYYDLFVRFCVDTFNMESVFFLEDMHKLKSLPASATDEEQQKVFHAKMKEMFDTYIDMNGQWSINIAATNRLKLSTLEKGNWIGDTTDAVMNAWLVAEDEVIRRVSQSVRALETDRTKMWMKWLKTKNGKLWKQDVASSPFQEAHVGYDENTLYNSNYLGYSVEEIQDMGYQHGIYRPMTKYHGYDGYNDIHPSISYDNDAILISMFAILNGLLFLLICIICCFIGCFVVGAFMKGITGNKYMTVNTNEEEQEELNQL